MPAAIDDRKGGVRLGVKFPDHLQHQQLVEIGIEQAAHDRVEPPAVIVGPGCDVCDCHVDEPYPAGSPATSGFQVGHYEKNQCVHVVWPG